MAVREQALLRAKAAYVVSARAMGRILGRAGLLPHITPSRDKRLHHWAFSLTHIHEPKALIDLDVPWWTYRAIDEVESWLAARPRPVSVFEYGSGASTLWLAKRAESVVTVEHQAGFAESMQSLFDSAGNIEVRVIAPRATSTPATPSRKEGYRHIDFSDYVATIDNVEGSFDLVVIDGRAREACLRRCVDRLRPDGMIVFDNSWRRRYRRAIVGSGLRERRLRGLTPTLPYPDATSLLTIPTV
jgi:hypothetical protein